MRHLFLLGFIALSSFLFSQEVKTLMVEKSSFNVIEEMKLSDQFLDSVFQMGQVIFKSGEVTRAYLNYNIVANAIFFLNDQNHMLQFIGLPQVRIITYKKRSYVPINAKEVGEIIAYYKNGTNLILRRHATIKNKAENRGAYGSSTVTSATDRITSIGNERTADVTIDKTTEIEVTVNSHYLVQKHSKFIPLRSMKDIKKLYPDKWDSIREFVNSNKIKLNSQIDVIRLLSFCNQNS